MSDVRVAKLAQALVFDYAYRELGAVTTPRSVLAHYGIDPESYGRVSGSTRGQSRIMQQVRNALNREAKRGFIERIGRGVYVSV
jgi:hypothetical protein